MSKPFLGMLPSIPLCDINNKEDSIRYYSGMMLDRTQSIFYYEGLPNTITQRNLELILQTNGFAGITNVNGDLYAFFGGLGGEPDPYYMPTILTVANPALDYSANLRIGTDCVVIPSDSMYIGLLPMFTRYASLIAENDITMRVYDINCRIASLLSAPDDRTRKAAEQYLKQVESGKLGVMAETAFLEGVKAQPYASAGNRGLTDLIEYQQYLKAGWYNDLGINSNYNMKREAINAQEAQLGDDALLPLIDDMLRCRRIGVDAVNAMYGTNISVELSSAWKQREAAEAAELAMLKAEQKNPSVENSVETVETKAEEVSINETESSDS